MTNKLIKQAGPPGWTAGANSVNSLDGDLQAAFTLVGGIGTLTVGLANEADPVEPPEPGMAVAINNIHHGVFAMPGEPISIMESGGVVATSDVAFTTDRAVTIRRESGVVTYKIGSWTYISEVPSTGGQRLMAALYDEGSAVDVPVFGEIPNGAQIDEVLTFSDSLWTDAFVYGWLSDGVSLTTTMAGDIELGGLLNEWLVFVNEYSPQANYEAMLTNLLRIRDNASATNQELLQYATNLITGAVGRYAGFDFEGFTRVGMSTYGWKRDGLYRIEDGDDNGDPISAIVEFASEAFANQMKTRIVALFFGLSTDGQVFVRLIDDNDREVLYRAKRQQAEYRSNPYQGNQSKRWGLRLEIVDATSVVLDSVEWVVGSTNRRTTT